MRKSSKLIFTFRYNIILGDYINKRFLHIAKLIFNTKSDIFITL